MLIDFFCNFEDVKTIVLILANSTASSFGADKTRMGFNAGLFVGRTLSPALSLEIAANWGKADIFTEFTQLTGKAIDSLPRHLHHSNNLWNTGVRLAYSLNIDKGKGGNK